MDKVWEVIGDSGKNGLPVSADEDPKSKKIGSLPIGTLVRQVAEPIGSRHLSGRRLNFSRPAGEPAGGWVTTCFKDQDFAVRNYDAILKTNSAPPLLIANGEHRPYDIVIYGATGFTGTLAMEHLDAVISNSSNGAGKCRWALAGRSADKLKKLAATCKSNPGVIEVNGFENLCAMASCCKVVIAAAGPYMRCGEEVIKACVKQHTHYVDVTGEVYWIHNMIAKYHDVAQKTGVMVVHAAGQICTIDEVCCYMLVQKLGPLKEFREYCNQFGSMTGGTQDTQIAQWASATADMLTVLRDPFSLEGKRKCGIRQCDEDCTIAVQDPFYQKLWLQPAYSTMSGSRILRRSSHLFDERSAEEVNYGKEVCFTIREPAMNQKVAQNGINSQQLPESVQNAVEVSKFMLEGVRSGNAPKPGQGPPPETREKYFSDFYAVAEGENGECAHVHYNGPEAYEVTAICCVSAALTIVEESAKLKPESRGGVLTPAYAFHGSNFIDRLQVNSFANRSGGKMSFTIHSGRPTFDQLKGSLMDKAKRAASTQGDMMQGKLKAFA